MIPGLNDILNCNPLNSINCPVATSGTAKLGSLGDLITGLLNVTISIAAFVAFFWLVWAAFQYITAGGDKNKLAEARSRITWAIVGLILILIAFVVAQFAAEVLPPKTGVPIL